MIGLKSTVSAGRNCQSHDALFDFLRCRFPMCQRDHATLSQLVPNSYRPRHPESGMIEMLRCRQLRTNRKARDGLGGPVQESFRTCQIGGGEALGQPAVARHEQAGCGTAILVG
jgi:hypothetical protein